LLFVEVFYFNSGAVDLGYVARGGVFAMDGGVASVPHQEEFFPDGGDDGCCP